MILNSTDKIERRKLTHLLRVYFGAYLLWTGVDCADEIAGFVKTTPEKILSWTETDEWKEALDFFNGSPCGKFLYASAAEKEAESHYKKAENAWKRMIRNGDHIKKPDNGCFRGVLDENKPPHNRIGVEYLHPMNRLKRFLSWFFGRWEARHDS